jgi:opacity protein-like surface antigen
MRSLAGAAAAALVLHAGIALAQDMNYNPFAPGARSALMGRAAVGGVRDSSAVFYNPGALAFVTESNIGLSANAFRYGDFRVHDALGSGHDLDATIIDVVPMLVSGSMRLGEDWALGYALVQQQQFSGGFRGAVRSVTDVAAVGLPGDETFLGQFDEDRNVDDIWGLAVASWRATPSLAVGGGPVLALRRETTRRRVSTNLQNTNTTPPVPVFALNQFFDAQFDQISLLAKLGAAWQPNERIRLGVTATTPGLTLYGEGEQLAEFTLATSIAGVGDVNVASLQRDLDTNYRIPWRVAAGAEFALTARWTVGLTAEYVDGLDRRRVLELDPAGDFYNGTPQFIGNSAGLELLDQRESVVNVAAGAEYRFGERYAGYLGFWTDFSPVNIDDLKAMLADDLVGNPLAMADVDVYNAVVGLSRRAADRLLAIGVTVAYGTGRVAGNLDFVDPDAIIAGGGRPGVLERKVSYLTGALLLSFTQFF